jgi:hypothetical protein
MTEQELKARIRKRIHRELGDIPDWVWEHYWNLSVVRYYLQGDTGWERDIMGEDGDIYVNQMKTVLETLNTVTQHNVSSFSLSRNRQQPTPREEMPRLKGLNDLEDMIEQWWNVLPERDKQAITQVWELAYNLLDAVAPKFRERFAGKRTLTPEESRQWFMDFFSAEAKGTRMMPTAMYLVSDTRSTSLEVCYDVIPFSDGTLFITHCEPTSFQEFFLFFLNKFAQNWGMTLSIVLRSLLTGERTPPRLVTRWYIFDFDLYDLAPVFPPYLSAEGVARVWSTVRFKGNARSWALSRCCLRRLRSYNEALQAWNRVTPEEWRIRDYRTFRRQWKRAQELVGFPQLAPQSGKHQVEPFADSVEWKLAVSFFIG